jgi:hypothetical protein
MTIHVYHVDIFIYFKDNKSTHFRKRPWNEAIIELNLLHRVIVPYTPSFITVSMFQLDQRFAQVYHSKKNGGNQKGYELKIVWMLYCSADYWGMV